MELDEENSNKKTGSLVNVKNSAMLKNTATLKMSGQIHFKEGDDFFRDLPDELFLQVLSFVKGTHFKISSLNSTEGKALANLATVNKRWKGIVDNFDELWKEIGKSELNIRESA